jgi:two-component system NtrC family sensor kinase
MSPEAAGRILVVDDQDAILDDFARLLEPAAPTASANALDALERQISGTPFRGVPVVAAPLPPPRYHVRYVRQGADAVRAAHDAADRGAPFGVAFVDVHMPPGIDGIETVAALWQANPALEVVLCTAYSDYSWQAIQARLGNRDQLLILRKPFDPIEVRQLAACLSEKWRRGRQLAQRLHDLEAQVAAEVEARLAQEVALHSAQKFDALGRLAAGIAHEINTPTQFIQSSLEFLEDAVGQLQRSLEGQVDAGSAALLAELPSAVADATEGVARVTRIVRSVREYAHPGSGRAREPVDVNHQLRAIVELARPEYKTDADVVLDLGELPPVPGHAEDLGRVFLNLLVNAAQAIHAVRRPGGRGQITIRSRHVGDDVQVHVTDTGGGIPAAVQARVFDPFFTTKPVGEGTGQGLMFARATVVDGHHGTLTFDTELGVGTTFHVTLPVTEPS